MRRTYFRASIAIAMLAFFSGCDAAISSWVGLRGSSSPADGQENELLTISKQIEVDEGDLGSISLALNSPATSAKSFSYSTQPLTATAGQHFVSQTGVVSIAKQSTNNSIALQTIETGITGAASKDFQVLWYDQDGKLIETTTVKIKPKLQYKQIATLAPNAPTTFQSIDMGTYALFAKWTPTNGTELWRSDGTAGGTSLLVDLCSGVCSSDPNSFVKLGSTVYFVARVSDGAPYQVFKSDGTAVGTTQPFTIPQITDSGLPNDELLESVWSQPYLITNSNRVFFMTSNEAEGNLFPSKRYRFYSTQGTLGTTFLMGSDDDNPYYMFIFNDQIFISGEDQVLFWTGAASGAGITYVRPSAPAACGGMPNSTRVIGNDLYTSCYDYGGSNYKLVRVNSSFNVASSYAVTWTGSATIHDSTPLYYFYTTSGSPKVFRRSDGTIGGDIALVSAVTSINPAVVGTLGGTVLFGFGTDLYKTDGTLVGTSILASGQSPSKGIGTIGTKAYYVAGGLWETDATVPGTREILSPDSESLVSPSLLYSTASEIYFSAATTTRGRELWYIDNASTVHLVSEAKPGTESSKPNQVVSLMGSLHYTAVNSSGSGVYPVLNHPSPVSPSAMTGYSAGTPDQVFSIGGDASFLTWTQSTAQEGSVLKSFTNSGGLQPTKVIDSGTGLRKNIVSVNSGRAIVEGYFPSITPMDPGLIFDLTTNTSTTLSGVGAYPKSFGSIPLGNGIVFSATDVSFYANREPHYIDFLTGTITKLADLVVGILGSNPFLIGKIGNYVYFIAGSSGARDLYKTDGTAIGTTLVVAIGSTGELGSFQLGNQYIFAATTAAAGREIWITDGTAGGTTMIKDIWTGASSSIGGVFPGIVVGSKLFFRASEPINGDEVWVTDGTLGGTSVLADLCVGICGSSPSYFFKHNNLAYFWRSLQNPSLDPGSHTTSQLYQSDGTSPGTTLVADILPRGVSNSLNTSLSQVLQITDYSLTAWPVTIFRFRPQTNPLPVALPGYSGLSPTLRFTWNEWVVLTDTDSNGVTGIYLAK